MSSKMGKRITPKKPDTTRRHDSLADGAFGYDRPESIRSPIELNRDISGEPSKQHSKYRRSARAKKSAKR
jgi:hypothetical protein